MPKPNKNVEVLVSVAYNYQKTSEIAEKEIMDQLEGKINKLHDGIDKMTVE